jgi:hypothetical protein
MKISGEAKAKTNKTGRSKNLSKARKPLKGQPMSKGKKTSRLKDGVRLSDEAKAPSKSDRSQSLKESLLKAFLG